MRTLRIKWDSAGRPTLPEMSDAIRLETPLVVLDYVAHLEAVVASMSDYVDMPAGVLEALPKVWAAGYTTTEQDGFWHLFAPGGAGIISAASFRELCAAIVSWAAQEDGA